MTFQTLPSQAYLRECFDYDPDTGIVTWKTRPREHFTSTKHWRKWNTQYAGKPRGNINRGRLRVRLNTTLTYLTRLIWIWMTDDHSPELIDHKDGNPLNDRWDNLRAATWGQNQQNRKRARTNTSGFKGVSRYPNYGCWVAHITSRGQRHHLGYFDTPEEAYKAYCEAAQRLHGEFARLG